MPIKLYTIGHGTRPLEEFGKVLQAHGIQRLVDIRTIPRSRHNPQFNKDSFPKELKKLKISYRHMPELGGLRKAKKDSVNLAWKNASFRGFADYMQTEDFERGLAELTELAEKETIAIMCAESVPWRCHRSLISDALSARGLAVEHIYSGTSSKKHKMTPWARVEGKQVTYPAEKKDG
ncbi:MAG: DUF488 domain-containing protein [Candidatus Omnitrophota bacterium]